MIPHLPEWLQYVGSLGGAMYLGNELNRQIVTPLLTKYIRIPRQLRKLLAEYKKADEEWRMGINSEAANNRRHIAAFIYNLNTGKWPDGYTPPPDP
jgi:hypothetical protein